MPNIRLPFNQPTAKWVANGATAVFLPWERQPPYHYTYLEMDNYAANFFTNTGLGGFGKSYKLPCQLGDTLYLLETWAYAGYITHDEGCGTDIIYKADNHSYRDEIEWCSPVTMPNSACRHVWIVGKIEVVQVKGLTRRKIVKIYPEIPDESGFGIHDEFETWFTSTCPHLSMDAWGWLIEKGDE